MVTPVPGKLSLPLQVGTLLLRQARRLELRCKGVCPFKQICVAHQLRQFADKGP